MFEVWQREGRRIGSSLREIGLSHEVILTTWTDYEHWLWIWQEDKRLGATRLRIQQELLPATQPAYELPDYTLLNQTRVTLGLLGMQMELSLDLEALLNPAFELQQFQAHLNLAGQPVRIAAFHEDDSFYYRLQTGQEALDEVLATATEAPTSPSQPTPFGLNLPWGGGALSAPAMLPQRDLCGRLVLEDPIVLRDVLEPLIFRTDELRPGQHWATDASNPILGSLDQTVEITVEEQETIEINGKQLKAWRLVERVGDLYSTAWYSPQGTLLRREMGNGLVFEQARPTEVIDYDPTLNLDQLPDAIDREYIKTHVEPELDGVPLEQLLPDLPQL